MDPDGTVVVVGADAEAVAADARDAGLGATVVAADAVGDVDADAIVTVGEDGFVAVARRRPATPVLPVDAPPGVGSVPRDGLTAALGGVADAPAIERTLFSVRAPDREVTAVFDATLVAAPTQMSEYAVSARVDGTERRIERVRADGVVVATPVGSAGHANAAGGPLVAQATGVAVVVPLAPYAIDRDRWVLAPPVRVAVEREAGAVRLFADGREVGPVEAGDAVEVAAAGTLSVVAVPGRQDVLPDS